MKVVRITNSFYETDAFGVSQAKFVGGEFYPLDADTQRQIDLRNAELVDAPDDAEKAEADAEKAEAKAASASTAAQSAKAAAKAAAAAKA